MSVHLTLEDSAARATSGRVRERLSAPSRQSATAQIGGIRSSWNVDAIRQGLSGHVRVAARSCAAIARHTARLRIHRIDGVTGDESSQIQVRQTGRAPVRFLR